MPICAVEGSTVFAIPHLIDEMKCFDDLKQDNEDLFLIVGDVLKEMKTHSFVDDPHFVDMMTALTSPLVKCKDCGVSYYRDTLTHEQDKCKAKDTIRDHWKPLPGCVVTGQDIANANVYVDVEILKNIDIRLIKDDESV